MSIKSLWKEAGADFEKNDALGKFHAGAQTAISTVIASLGIEGAVQDGDYKFAVASAAFAVTNTILTRFELRRRAKQNNSGPGGLR